jgi:NAD(P)-dependent dehydrogenase (short-subunit alcohol dehydrogenase family)
MSQLRFDNRVAVITGAGRGLGRAYALLLASRGAKIVVNDPGGSLQGQGVDTSPAQDVVREIKVAGGDAVACTESVATPEGGSAIIKAALGHYGRIDILIHSAGNVRRGSLKEMTYEDFDAVLDVHLRGAFHVVRAAFPHMCKAGYGRIVLTSSDVGLYGRPRVANYAVSKAGMIGLSNVAALEGAEEGVKCNTIIPAAVTRMAGDQDTSAFPPTMQPEMVAHAVGWLAHESCSITGRNLLSVGGRVARALVAETRGVFRDDWSIEEIAKQMDAIQNADTMIFIDPYPSGHDDHLRYSFDMAKSGAPQK